MFLILSELVTFQKQPFIVLTRYTFVVINITGTSVPVPMYFPPLSFGWYLTSFEIHHQHSRWPPWPVIRLPFFVKTATCFKFWRSLLDLLPYQVLPIFYLLLYQIQGLICKYSNTFLLSSTVGYEDCLLRKLLEGKLNQFLLKLLLYDMIVTVKDWI